MKRRDFLKTPGYFIAAASLAKFAGTGCDNELESAILFPQGVASGDPRSSSVVLWTRVARSDNNSTPIDVIVQVSDADDFVELVLEEKVTVTADSDHTLRMVVTELSPATTYFYRFIADGTTSRTGQTLTAPPADDMAPVRLAWVSCQDFSAGFYGAYREIIKEDESRPADQKIQFIVHLGDFIYETAKDGFQTAIDQDFKPVALIDRDGNPRELKPFPSLGGSSGGTGTFAQTVDDYRHLYKSFLSDPDLQDARARWPFIVTWDDHEFTNDAWQTQANYKNAGKPGDSLDEPSQKRKLAANQAWFEYIPAQLTGASGVAGVTQKAADFKAATVEDTMYSAVDADNQVSETNNRAAIDSMTIYRSFRYGKHVELVITDQRSYRSDHPIPEDLVQGLLFFDPRNVMPFEMVDIFDKGMTANGGNPPDVVIGTPNPRKASPPGTMLGPQQKAWWKETMQKSDATWKIWGNEVPMMRFIIDNGTSGPLVYDRIMNTDAWDGYNTERKELMSFLRTNNINNVVVITGDIHANLAGLVMDDYDAVDPATPQPAAVELCAAGIATNSLFSFFEDATRSLDGSLRTLVTYDASAMSSSPFTENVNVLLLHGLDAAVEAAATHSLPAILAKKDPTINPHLRYVDTNAQGFGLLTVAADQVTARLVTINRPIEDDPAGPGILRSASFTITKDQTELAEPTITGSKPFPLDLPSS